MKTRIHKKHRKTRIHKTRRNKVGGGLTNLFGLLGPESPPQNTPPQNTPPQNTPLQNTPPQNSNSLDNSNCPPMPNETEYARQARCNKKGGKKTRKQKKKSKL
jgi:hypothetical protein